MNVLMLRGLYPRDRKNPMEIFYDSIEQETDMWTELLYAALRSDELCDVVYLDGPHRCRHYSNSFSVWCFGEFHCQFAPDVLFCRGGFKEYSYVMKQCVGSKTVYYGAGKRCVPDRKFDMVLVDCQWQADAVAKKWPGTKVRTIIKPASHIFRPVEVEKKYDVCFVAIHPSDPRKRVEWVYDTVPKGISVLQLGNSPKGKVPKNVTVKHVSREKMPKAMSKCRVGIAPYTKDDSGPRVVPEFAACGLPVVCTDDLSIRFGVYGAIPASKAKFWDTVRVSIGADTDAIVRHYKANLSLPAAADVLRGYFEEVLDG